MLVIRRRSGESFFLGPDIEVQILNLESGQVKVGIRAPAEVAILRKEVKETQEANRLAAEAAQTLPQQSLHALLRALQSPTPRVDSTRK
jgi:carbon storage regulator